MKTEAENKKESLLTRTRKRDMPISTSPQSVVELLHIGTIASLHLCLNG